jgi:hypothetical protein
MIKQSKDKWHKISMAEKDKMGMDDLLKFLDEYGGGPSEIRDEGNWIDQKRITPAIRKRLRDIFRKPANRVFPDLPTDMSNKCGTFKIKRNPMTKEWLEGAVMYHLADLAYEKQFSVFDWAKIYIENSFCDNDGANIMININASSQYYGRLMVHETFDDGLFTLLTKECDLRTMYEEYNAFQPNIESRECSEQYFVSFLANKYGE